MSHIDISVTAAKSAVALIISRAVVRNALCVLHSLSHLGILHILSVLRAHVILCILVTVILSFKRSSCRARVCLLAELIALRILTLLRSLRRLLNILSLLSRLHGLRRISRLNRLCRLLCGLPHHLLRLRLLLLKLLLGSVEISVKFGRLRRLVGLFPGFLDAVLLPQFLYRL